MGGFQKGKSKQKFKTDSGITKAYRRYKRAYCPKDVKNKYHIKQVEYGKIIKLVHEKIIKEIIYKGLAYKLPSHLGEIFLVKYKPAIKIVDGKVVNKNYVDWIKTHEMWNKNPELRGKKFYRFTNDHSNNFVYCFRYCKRRMAAGFAGYRFYEFYPTREIGKMVKEASMNPNFDCRICKNINFKK